MMDGFSPVNLSWKGVEYTIQPNQMLGVIRQIEEAIRGRSTRQAVEILLQPGGPNYGSISAAYGAALRAAGCNVSDDEIYLSIQQAFMDGNVSNAEAVQNGVLGLLSIMSPPLALALSEPDSEKKGQAAE